MSQRSLLASVIQCQVLSDLKIHGKQHIVIIPLFTFPRSGILVVQSFRLSLVCIRYSKTPDFNPGSSNRRVLSHQPKAKTKRVLIVAIERNCRKQRFQWYKGLRSR